MILFPNAKINIGLKITNKRSDGFHDIVSCFYPIDWSDILEITPNQESLAFESTGIEIPGSGDNLCVKAYQLLEQEFKIPPVHIHLHKIIPIGAGLGGGSADATFTLKALNELYTLGLSSKELQQYARALGSDCAFFVENTPVLATGKGDVFNPIDLQLNGKVIVLIYPSIHIGTAEAYAGVKPEVEKIGLEQLLVEEIGDWQSTVENDFEQSLNSNHSYINELKNELIDLGAVYTSLSGSGSTVYGIFNQAPNLEGKFKDYLVKVANL